MLADKPDAVLIAPNFEEETLELTTGLDADAVPYALLTSIWSRCMLRAISGKTPE